MRFRLVAAAGIAAAIAVSLAVLGLSHTYVVLAVLAGTAVATGAGTALIIRARQRGHSGSLTRQLALVIAMVIVPVLVALAVMGRLMFVSSDDAALVGVIVAISGITGVAAARHLANSLGEDVGRIRDGLVAVGDGERDVRLEASTADELRELAQAATAMIQRLGAEEAARDQSEAARRDLIAAASHDLRTPITSLRLLAEAVDDKVVDGNLRSEYVRRMLTHIEALSALIDDLFELSRLQAGDINWTLERVALGELLTESVDAMRVQAQAKGILVQTDLPIGLGEARANPEKLQRVLFNLIQNAIRHSPVDGSVVIRAETLSDMVEVEIEDHGDGISTADRERVFEAFYRGGPEATRTTSGAGLGLAVARAIVEAHGGRIWLPATDDGTRVRFSVPVAG